MKIDEAIQILETVSMDERVPDDIGRAAEMGHMALSIMVETHDRISEFVRFYNEIEEIVDKQFN